MTWHDNDLMMYLVDESGKPITNFPAKCPVCGKEHAHILMHRFSDRTGFGTFWAWCDNCFSYTHCSYRVPKWWINPAFLDLDRLDSLVDYPHELQDKIDSWVNKLLE